MRMQVRGSDAKDAEISTAIINATTCASDHNPAAVYLASLSTGSRRAMHQALRVVANLVAPRSTIENFPWASVRFQHVAAVRSHLLDSYSPASGNKILAALRGTLKAAFALGQLDGTAYTQAVSIKAIRGDRVIKGRALSQEELRLMFATCDTTTPAGARDAALLALTYGSGLRRHEVVGLSAENFNRCSGTIVVRGKGSKERQAYITNGSRTALETWLAVRGNEPGPLFKPVNKAGVIENRRMSDQAVYWILQRLAVEAKIQRFSPHDLRRTFIGDLLDAGVDISTVQQLAAHSSITTTSRYDRRPERTRRRAAEMLHVPFEG